MSHLTATARDLLCRSREKHTKTLHSDWLKVRTCPAKHASHGFTSFTRTVKPPVPLQYHHPLNCTPLPLLSAQVRDAQLAALSNVLSSREMPSSALSTLLHVWPTGMVEVACCRPTSVPEELGTVILEGPYTK